jgi:hypothetical protein
MALPNELKLGVLVKGFLPGSTIIIIDVERHGDIGAELIYKDRNGHLGSELLYKERIDELEIAACDLPWSFQVFLPTRDQLVGRRKARPFGSGKALCKIVTSERRLVSVERTHSLLSQSASHNSPFLRSVSKRRKPQRFQFPHTEPHCPV